MVRIVDRIIEGGRGGGTRTCQEPGCPNSTREGKPYCLDHIERGCYASHIVSELARRSREQIQLRKHRWIGEDSHYVREVLSILVDRGEITAGCLTRTLDLDMDQSAALLSMMGRYGLVRVGRTSRGTVTARRLG